MRLTDEIRATLVKMADKFDQQGKFDLAEKIDSTLTSEAARPKAPLKSMNDDLKKSLIVFLLDADKGMQSGVSGLNELFRRMRYFDISDSIKDLGLDRVVKDMQKTQECLDGAKKDFYTMTFGKRPSKADLDKLLEELSGKKDDADDGQQALDFFNAQTDDAEDKDMPHGFMEEDELEKEESLGREPDWDSMEDDEYEEEPMDWDEEDEMGKFWDDSPSDKPEYMDKVEETFEDEDEEQ